MTAATPLFRIATEQKLPRSTTKAEIVVGDLRLEAKSQCDKRGSLILSDYKAAAEMGGGFAAQQNLIHCIRQAEADSCAVAVRVFKHS